MKTKLYRTVSTEHRLPEIDKMVIGLWDGDENVSAKVSVSENGYWTEEEFGTECDAPDYWLEEVELPSKEYLPEYADDNDMYNGEKFGFIRGAEFVLDYIEGGKS